MELVFSHIQYNTSMLEARSVNATVTGDMNSLLVELEHLHKVSCRHVTVCVCMISLVCIELQIAT